MAANAYRIQTSVHDKAIAELLIAGFVGQLKGWWDYHLTSTEHLNIVNAVKINEDGESILVDNGQTIQDVVSTLILTSIFAFFGRFISLKRQKR